MTYDEVAGMYTATIILKQGFYNYSFVTKNRDAVLDVHEISGTHYQTENEYQVLVYYKPFGTYYDSVIGIGTGFFNQR